MKKTRIALLLSLLLALLVVTSVFAGGFSVVKYDDTEVSDYSAGDVGGPQYIANGDFNAWVDGKPAFWNVPDPIPLSPNWEVHFAQMDYSEGGDGMSYAMGMFFRTGSSGSQFAGLSQQVSPELTTGQYWVQVHITAWEYNTTSPYNAVAWYGFGTSDDSNSVTEWRELFPDTYVCANADAICNHLARKELVTVEAGSYLHVRMGMKFPDHQAWTVFGLDDISITDLSDGIDADVTGFVDDGDVTWSPSAPR